MSNMRRVNPAKKENLLEGSHVNRRNFVLSGAATALAAFADGLPTLKYSASKTGVNLIPETPSGAPNYWCTWAVQNYMYGHHLQELSPEILEGDSDSRLAHNAMNEQVLLGKDGWAHAFFPRIRKDLYLMLDDGWESGGTATFELDAAKFPSFSGSPAERLAGLNKAIQAADWRGAALWCRNTPGGIKDERLEMLSQDADVRYWKIDIGDPEFHLVDVRKSEHTQLQFEHVHGEPPLNGDWHRDGRFGTQFRGSRRQQILAHTDVYRTYDVTSILSLPTTLDRLAEMLKGAQGQTNVHALLNVEDEVYVAAVIGCTMGVLRHPLDGLRPGPDTDLFFNGPRKAKRRMDEVVRALRWQRIAPPFAAGSGSIEVSNEILTDSWTFERGQTWETDLVGLTTHQGAPACIARNIALPRVTSSGEKPFVFVSKFPNGAVAVGIQERTRPGRAWYMPLANVELNVGDAQGPIGVFGSCATLSLIFDKPLAGKRILAQDLASDVALDVTDRVRIDGQRLQLTEANLRSFGLRTVSKGDLSSPGIILALR
ncbi:hypothetical protein [Alloacidobacterium sp.]|uniref:hypothetical protein n=1 Tax=Alloacidobacterium sp. TaxID=2951999 RepID=UPI002D5122A3|nr:hypothetical protein [Alloacidobacterium sp.]HYK37429.1 hypothetical protein [Alloacidobacterium sp.]